MPKVKLTDAAVQKYKAGPGVRVEYFDVLLPGFALRVAGPTKRTAEVRKTWVLFYVSVREPQDRKSSAA